MTEMKNMPFLMMKRTQSCMFLRVIHVFSNFHFVKIINFARKSCLENDDIYIKTMT